MDRFKLYAARGDEWFSENIPCQRACPVLTAAGRYVSAIAQGDFDTAYGIAREPNPFAYVCGRVCGAPCESACRRGTVDAPISIRALKRSAAELRDLTRGHAPGLLGHSPRSERVAVIGAGPAGLACAHDLARLGYRVTIFDAAKKPGGMLQLGLPQYRLPRDVVDMEVAGVLNLGVELQCSQAAGKDFRLRDLKEQGFTAIFIAVGAQRSRDIPIEGLELDGVLKGVEFLLNVNLGYRVWLGHKVIVIGGGNVAIDVARTASREGIDLAQATTTMDVARAALRLGTREVHVMCLESREEMPAHGYEVEEAEKEGVIIHPSVGPKRIMAVNGKVVGLETIRCTAVFDAQGRFNPQFQENTESITDCDSIILSIGQTADLSWLEPDDGIETTRRGTIQVEAETLATTASGIFAGGDVAFGPRLIINAVADGRKAARSIHQYLRGNATWRSTVRTHEVAIRYSYDTYDAVARHIPKTLPLQRRVGFTEVELPYSRQEAESEADRCLQCHKNIFLDGERCILCGGCVDVCPYQCIQMVSASRIDWGALAEQVSPEACGGRGYAMILDETRCIRCGLCVQRCPTDAIGMRVFEIQGEWVYD